MTPLSRGYRTGTYQRWPPEPRPKDSEDARHDERTHDQRVEQQADAYGGTHLTDGSQVAGKHRQHGEREHQTRRRHHTTGASERADQAGVDSGVNLLFDTEDQQEVVVGSHRHQDDERERQYQPVQGQANEVLPDEYGKPERAGVGEGHGGGDDQGGHQTSGQEQHDQEDQHEGSVRHDKQIGQGVFLDVLVG